VAYAPTMAAALSGATVPHLRHWRNPRTGPLLAPEISAESRIIYSFRDLLALRTFVHLRQNASLQRIRKAVGSLRDLGEIQHPGVVSAGVRCHGQHPPHHRRR
jgi:DNA-binding transcriptional MerR regulator